MFILLLVSLLYSIPFNSVACTFVTCFSTNTQYSILETTPKKPGEKPEESWDNSIELLLKAALLETARILRKD